MQGIFPGDMQYDIMLFVYYFPQCTIWILIFKEKSIFCFNLGFYFHFFWNKGASLINIWTWADTLASFTKSKDAALISPSQGRGEGISNTFLKYLYIAKQSVYVLRSLLLHCGLVGCIAVVHCVLLQRRIVYFFKGNFQRWEYEYNWYMWNQARIKEKAFLMLLPSPLVRNTTYGLVLQNEHFSFTCQATG